jgi:hypothetical protein
VLPTRTIRSHTGAVTAGPAVLTVTPPSAVRRWNAVPLAGDTMIEACGDEASVALTRIMIPALVQTLTGCRESTRVSI